LGEVVASPKSKLHADGSIDQDVIIQQLEGILLLGDWNLVRTESIDSIQGVCSVGVGLLGKNNCLLDDLNQRFIGKPLTFASMQELKQSIASYYESKNQPLVVVSTPRQEVTKGILQLVVSEAKLGEVRCKGNRYFSSKQLQKYIRAEKGAPIDAKSLYEDLAFMNHNPFRRTDAVFTPGSKAGIADLELLTVDRWPYRVYAGADNTGTVKSERNRIFFGVNLGKTIVQDSEVSYQYTQAPNGNRFFNHNASVRVPLPWFRHILQAYGGYANVQLEPTTDATLSNQTVQVKPRGISWDVSLRYHIPLYNNLDLLQELIVGYDFKESHVSTRYDHKSAHKGTASINQFVIGYNVGLRTRSRKLFFNAEILGNPSSITHHNNEKSYQKLRNDAQAQYIYLQASHSLAQEFSSWWFSYDLSGQWSSTNLLPSEQFTMTGYYAVRGFEERILNVDNGGIIHITIETPHVSPAHWCGFKKHYDELYVLAFFDAGVGAQHKPADDQQSIASLGSIGPSLRYQYSHYISAHLDYGFQLWHSGFENGSDSRYNFGVTLSY
jgi:hemolysin activation/secretion protein